MILISSNNVLYIKAYFMGDMNILVVPKDSETEATIAEKGLEVLTAEEACDCARAGCGVAFSSEAFVLGLGEAENHAQQ
ncbi:hypothetical protein MHO82_24610 [Vibrio sp. Of7-15]|uniref:hypothetical protein n=1 Tax=Vibrio sp. Of7-15 TaxID=2724879 RepID=UPI001EF39C69|nr:hypothetical protein [Vibrio sp. Of7-15]MCG7500050.1 hypothetical protein [Vibrio sp. Of7-15]